MHLGTVYFNRCCSLVSDKKNKLDKFNEEHPVLRDTDPAAASLPATFIDAWDKSRELRYDWLLTPPNDPTLADLIEIYPVLTNPTFADILVS